MIVAHRLTNREYSIDCEKYEIATIGHLKSYLLNYIEGVRYDNIKILGCTGELVNETNITPDMTYLGLIIVPIICRDHQPGQSIVNGK